MSTTRDGTREEVEERALADLEWRASLLGANYVRFERMSWSDYGRLWRVNAYDHGQAWEGAAHGTALLCDDTRAVIERPAEASVECGEDAEGHAACVESPKPDDRVRCALSPCGGNPVGEWRASHLCARTLELPACAAVRLSSNDVAVSGGLSFASDGSFTASIRVQGTYQGAVPPYCALDLGCSGVAALLTQESAARVLCNPSADGGCACRSPILPSWDSHGAYVVSQSIITLHTTARATNGELRGRREGHAFCVHGNVLELRLANGALLTLERRGGH